MTVLRRDLRRRRSRVPPLLRDLIVIVVIAVLASFLIKTYLIRSFYIASTSMQNTLQKNDRVLVDEFVPGVIPLRRGDVIVFKDPGGWLTDPHAGDLDCQIGQVKTRSSGGNSR